MTSSVQFAIGHTGDVATSILIPAVVDLCRGKKSSFTGTDIFVVAAGGISDGRGMWLASARELWGFRTGELCCMVLCCLSGRPCDGSIVGSRCRVGWYSFHLLRGGEDCTCARTIHRQRCTLSILGCCRTGWSSTSSSTKCADSRLPRHDSNDHLHRCDGSLTLTSHAILSDRASRGLGRPMRVRKTDYIQDWEVITAAACRIKLCESTN